MYIVELTFLIFLQFSSYLIETFYLRANLKGQETKSRWPKKQHGSVFSQNYPKII